MLADNSSEVVMAVTFSSVSCCRSACTTLRFSSYQRQNHNAYRHYKSKYSTLRASELETLAKKASKNRQCL